MPRWRLHPGNIHSHGSLQNKTCCGRVFSSRVQVPPFMVSTRTIATIPNIKTLCTLSQCVQVPTPYMHRHKSKDIGTTERPRYIYHTATWTHGVCWGALDPFVAWRTVAWSFWRWYCSCPQIRRFFLQGFNLQPWSCNFIKQECLVPKVWD